MKSLIGTFVIVLWMMPVNNLLAQHEHHTMSKAADTVVAKNGAHHSIDTMHPSHKMSHLYSRNLPMNRNGSGTAWLPDASPMYMYMTGKKAMWMFHGNVFARYTNTGVFDSKRGGAKLDAPNWFMGMYSRMVGKRGLLSVKAMMSLDRLTEGGDGYPLLFQSGETWKGKPLVDRQHPHDLFTELSVGYSHAFTKDIDVFGYLGYPGEPALSAPAFMHRVSAINIPDAPLSHHWQDATHITFGTGTLGVRYRQFKVEGSIFTGREPDENRYDFDAAKFDSYSYRLSWNPTSNWALQFSQGFIHSPEVHEPLVDVKRTTASVLYSKRFGRTNHLNMASVWGLNDKGAHHREHSLLVEGNYQFAKNAVFGRYEFVQKSADELDVEQEVGHRVINIQVLGVGYNRKLWESRVVELLLGGMVTLNRPGRVLEEVYGRMPVGMQVYLQLRPAISK